MALLFYKKKLMEDNQYHSTNSLVWAISGWVSFIIRMKSLGRNETEKKLISSISTFQISRCLQLNFNQPMRALVTNLTLTLSKPEAVR